MKWVEVPDRYIVQSDCQDFWSCNQLVLSGCSKWRIKKKVKKEWVAFRSAIPSAPKKIRRLEEDEERKGKESKEKKKGKEADPQIT